MWVNCNFRGLGLGVNFSKHGGGRRGKRKGVGEGVWAYEDGGKVRKGG